MMFRPIQRISIILIKIILKYFKVDSDTFMTIFKSLFIGLTGLVSTIGIIPTLRGLFRIRRYLPMLSTTTPTAAIALLERFLIGIHPRVRETLLNILTPFTKMIISNNRIYSIAFSIFSYSYLFICLKSIFYYIIRLSLGLILTSIGIMWNESLNAISYLNSFSNFIINLLENKLNFNIPRLSIDNVHSLTNTVTETIKESYDNNSYYFNILGIILITGLSLLASVCVIEYYFPEIINQNLPDIGTFAENINNKISSLYHTILDWFNTPKSSGSTDNSVSSEQISRTSSGSSSGSSTSTIRLNDARTQTFTPPVSRTGTPIPIESRYPNINPFSNMPEDLFNNDFDS